MFSFPQNMWEACINAPDMFPHFHPRLKVHFQHL